MTFQPIVKFLRLHPHRDSDLPLPRYMSPHAAGMDIYAAIEQQTALEPGDIALIPTGFSMALPPDFEAQIRPRSGLASKHGIGLVNSPGTIDADYRGEVKIALINWGKQRYIIHRGDRIAQMIIHKTYRARVVQAQTLDDTQRNDGGFGHTGR